MYYRHHSEHWLQKWFSAGSLMTLSLILVFWDLTLSGLWPLEMMKTLISCILNNTGLLPGPWILPLQWHVWLTLLRMEGCAPKAVLCCYEVTMISPSAQGDLFPGPFWQLHLVDSSLALWNRGLPLHPLSERCLLWEHAPWYLSLNSFYLIYRILQLEYTSKTVHSASIVTPASSTDTECSKSNTTKTVNNNEN